MKNIVIADDHGIVRMGLNILCKKALPESRIEEVESIGDLYKKLRTYKPDLLILDLFLGEVNTLNSIQEILKFQPALNILVVSMASENLYGNRAIKEGAKGYISKAASDDYIVKAISRVGSGKHYMSEELYYASLDDFLDDGDSNPFNRLTNKEMEIAELMLQGLSTNEIGNTANLAPSTISTFKMRIFGKLNIKNIMELSDLAKVFKLK